MQEIKADFSDKWLADQITVMKALSTIQCRDARLTEEGYRTEAALLNSALVHQLSNWELICSPKKVVGYLSQLDALVVQGEGLSVDGNSLNRLRGFVKSLLYSRVGDYLLSKLVMDDCDGAARDNHILRCATLAYQWALVHLSENGDNTSADQALDYIEIALMLHSSAELVRSPTRHGVSHRGFMHLLSTGATLSTSAGSFSFLSRDIESRLDHPLAIPSRRDAMRSIANTWPLRNGAHFLNRLSWILATGREACGFFTFVDESLMHVRRFPTNLDEPCSPEALTTLDIKVFLFRTALHVEAAKKEGITFPWTLSTKPTALQSSVWEAMVAVTDSQKLELNSVVVLTNAIEELRLLMPSQSDKSHLLRTLCFLASLLKLETASREERKSYYELGTRYAHSILQQVEMGMAVTNGSLLRRRILFPTAASETVSAIVSDAEMCRMARDFIGRKSIPSLAAAKPAHQPNPSPDSPPNGAAMNGTLNKSHALTDDADDSMANISFKSACSHNPAPSPRPAQQQKDEQGGEVSVDETATLFNTTKETGLSHCSSGSHEEARELRSLISRFTHHNALLAKLISSTQQLSLSPTNLYDLPVAREDELAVVEDGNSVGYSEKLWSISTNFGSSSEADPNSQWDTAIIPSPTRPPSKQAVARQSLEELREGKRFEHVRFLQNPRTKQVDCCVTFHTMPNGLYSLCVASSQDGEVEYVMDEGSHFQVVSLTTIRLVDLKRDGDEEDPILLTFSAETGQHSAFKDLLYKAGQLEK